MKRTLTLLAAAMMTGLSLTAARAQMPVSVSGTVVETMNAGGYTYALLDTGSGKKWIASKPFPVTVGEKVTTGEGYEMKNFASPTLNRTFDSIFFVSAVATGTNKLGATAMPAGHGSMGGGHGSMGGAHAGMHGGASSEGPGITGEVVETLDAGPYTYVRVKSAKETIWAATDKMEVKVGNRVTVPPGELMTDFKSSTLKRTFDSIYFVSAIMKEGETPHTGGAMPLTMPPSSTAKKTSAPPPLAAPIAQPAGGTSIAHIHAGKAGLAGKEVTVKGQVTKFTQRVMNRNWVHITDGSGKGADNDLTITTDSSVNVGDIIVFRGRLAIDKDFGYGYSYPVLVENAAIVK